MLCYTIGHSTRTLEDFIDIIKEYGIDLIIDIRSELYISNKYSEVYNKKTLEDSILGLKYIYFGKNLKFLKDSSANLDKAIQSIEVKKIINKIMLETKKGHKVALMCNERNPFNCYRSILLGYVLKNNKITVEHIIDKGNIKTQDRIEEELFVTYEPVLKKEFVKLTLQDVFDNDDYDKISEKNLKHKVIERGYREKFLLL